MNKSVIEKSAIEIRRILIQNVTDKAWEIGITKNQIESPGPMSTENVQFYTVGNREITLTGKGIAQRVGLVTRIRKAETNSDYSTAYNSVIEEIAYTWFNRLIAIRFMEVNNYLPGHTRILSSRSPDKNEPDIVTRPFDSDLVFSDAERKNILEMKDQNRTEELFRFLFLRQCHQLGEILPGLFKKTEDYAELLLNISYNNPDNVVWRLVHNIPEEDFDVSRGGQVEIIGWLYQYYNTERKADVFAGLKKNIKITKENIPVATQLFTPDWIVRYMVENSLGRLWLEGHPNEELKSSWKYYLDEAQQEPDVAAELAKSRSSRKDIKPQEIKLIDPCMGSGHILVYAFDVFMQIYESCGYSKRDAVAEIVQNNLFGLDIDDRASQLAYFAVMMKARAIDRRFLERGIQPNLYAIEESNDVTDGTLDRFAPKDDLLVRPGIEKILTELRDAKEYGSMITVSDFDQAVLDARIVELCKQQGETLLKDNDIKTALEQIPRLVRVAKILAQKYEIVVTNPPYMGCSGMNAKLSDYVKKYYPDSKSDMSTICMEKTISMCNKNGYMAMINIPVWMFLSSYERLRSNIITNNTISTMVHPGRGIFGSDFGTTSFVIAKNHIPGYVGSYRRLFDKQGEVESIETREQRFFEGRGKFTATQDNFSKIPGSPIAYWVSEKSMTNFINYPLNNYGTACLGMRTGDNKKFLRFWFEVQNADICKYATCKADGIRSGCKWFPYNKGGEYRRWYGNQEYVVNWKNDGSEIKENTRKVYPQLGDNLGWKISNEDKYFLPGITWSRISSAKFGVRYCPPNMIFDTAAPMFFPCDKDKLYHFLGYMCSIVAYEYMQFINPTIAFQVGDVASLPCCLPCDNRKCDKCVSSTINISRLDWDTYETSWDFKRNPFIAEYQSGKYAEDKSPLSSCYESVRKHWREMTEEMHRLEVENNKTFIGIYGLEDELSPDVSWKDITLTCNPWYRYGIEPEKQTENAGACPVSEELEERLLRDTIKEFVSYFVGCMFGRYSPDKPGLILAGQGISFQDYVRELTGDPDLEITVRHTKESFTLNSKAAWNRFIKSLDSPYFPRIINEKEGNAFYLFADEDNCIPIADNPVTGFDDDIVILFTRFVETVFGRETLESNLRFISQGLSGKSGDPCETIRDYFINEFYKDHCKMYHNRPIYWMFNSGKENGFKALFYLHRYTPDTIGNMRIEYLRHMQEVYENQIQMRERLIETSPDKTSNIKAKKKIDKMRKQLAEIRTYDEKIAHLANSRIELDLDDGVKVNYEKLQTDSDGDRFEILTRIK